MATAQSPSDKRFYVYGYVRGTHSRNGSKGTFYYIGKGHGKRANHRATHRVKLPSDKSNITIIAQEMNEKDALQAEMLLIFLYGRIDCGRGCLRNKTDGGDGSTGYIYTEEQRQKLRGNKRGQGNKGMKRSEEFCRMISEMKKGNKLRPHTEETREKIRQSLMGHTVSDESRKKMSRIISEETRERLRLSHLGKKASEETKRRMSVSRSAYLHQNTNRGG